MWTSQTVGVSQTSSAAQSQLTNYEQALISGHLMEMSAARQGNSFSNPVSANTQTTGQAASHAPTQPSGAEMFARTKTGAEAETEIKSKSRFMDTLSNTSSWAIESLSAILSKTKSPEQEKMSLSAIRLRFELCLQDVEGTHVQTLRLRIRNAREIKELWLMRNDLHGIIAKRFSQQEAARRINDLLPCFKGWINDKLLHPI